jgi:hypothetical protein
MVGRFTATLGRSTRRMSRPCDPIQLAAHQLSPTAPLGDLLLLGAGPVSRAKTVSPTLQRNVREAKSTSFLGNLKFPIKQ